MTNGIDARQLVRWLGPDGARSGLLNSKRVTVDVLKHAADDLNLAIREKATKEQLVDAIIEVASKRIDKSLEALLGMDRQEILRYFEAIEVEAAEILDLLKQMNLQPRRESRRSLLEFAAQELSETGRFMRIAGNPTTGTKNEPLPTPTMKTKTPRKATGL